MTEEVKKRFDTNESNSFEDIDSNDDKNFEDTPIKQQSAANDNIIHPEKIEIDSQKLNQSVEVNIEDDTIIIDKVDQSDIPSTTIHSEEPKISTPFKNDPTHEEPSNQNLTVQTEVIEYSPAEHQEISIQTEKKEVIGEEEIDNDFDRAGDIVTEKAQENQDANPYLRKLSNDSDFEREVPTQDRTVTDRIMNQIKLKDLTYENCVYWEKTMILYMIEAKEALDHLLAGLKFANMEVSAKHKTITGFYNVYLGSYHIDTSNINDQNLFLSRVISIDAAMKHDERYKLDVFERAIYNQHAAEFARKKHVAEFKREFSKEVLDKMYNDIYKNPKMLDCIQIIKDAEKLKVFIESNISNANLSAKEFHENFRDSKTLNMKRKRSKNCNIQKLRELYNGVSVIGAELNNYAKLIYKIIDTSIIKERETMKAISSSYKRFQEVNRKYFGKEANDYYLSAYQELEKLIDENLISDLFSITKLLGQNNCAIIAEKINTEVSTMDDLDFYLSGLYEIDAIHYQMSQFNAKVKITEETKFKKTRFPGIMYFSYDDIISIYSTKENSTEFIDFHVADMDIKNLIPETNTVIINYFKKSFVFKANKVLTIVFESQDDYLGFLEMYKESHNYYMYNDI